MTDKNQTLLQADSSPAALVKQSGVRRVNNLPVIIVAGMLAVFLISMVMVAMDRNEQQDRTIKAREEKAESSQGFASEIASNHAEGIIASKGIAAAGTDVPDTLLSQRSDGGADLPITPPLFPGQAQAQTMPSLEDEALNRRQLLELQQLDAAVKSKTAISLPTLDQRLPAMHAPQWPDGTTQLTDVRRQLASMREADASASYQSGLALQKGTIPAGSGSDVGSELRQPLSDRHDMAQFNQTGTADRWQLDSRPQPPRSPYELRAGFVVPATLISGINSELPGQIMGQVAQNVFDTATGRYVLIPQGARLVGAYSSNIAYGQARILIAWQRIIFPDGKAMDIGAMPGADAAGYAGFNDQVNHHYLRIFGSALLMSGVVAGVTMSQPAQNNNASPTFSSAMSQALGQQLGDAAAQLINKNMNIAPTLEIRPGYRFNVIVTKDMTFARPYQSFDY